ncbi:MAG: SMC-Scp complex subunit ScpB [Lachnospiraceae bacterium]|nr:SMC-Scp complex subunit ScpB [Lachnospiraceae bacterium]
MDEFDELKEKKAALEAILFAMGKAVPCKTLAAAIGEEPGKTEDLLRELAEEMRGDAARGICLISLDDAWQLSTKREMYDYLIRAAVQPRKQVLTDAVLETLSIIAYKQPVTRSEIEKIRGVKSDHAVNKLIEFGLIEEKGRLEAPGRPILFGTTEEFLRRFGMPNLGSLPQMDTEQAEEIRLEAEAEISLKSND